MNTFIKASLIRSIRTVCQTLASMIPAGFVITPSIIQGLEWSFLYVVLAWFGTGILAGVASMLTSIATGLPEVELENNLYMYHDEPADSEVNENDE